MPNIVGSSETISEVKNLGYKYPMGLDLKPGGKLHTQLVDRLFQMARDSQSVMRRRWSRWEEIEATLTAYALLEDDEEERTTSVVVPVSYATLDTLLTYWLSTFASGPLFRYQGVGPEDRDKAMLLELLIDMQCKRLKTLLGLHTQWRDSIAYGLGVVGVRWDREYARKWVKTEVPVINEVTGEILGIEVRKEKRRTLAFEGNVLDNVSPFNYLPDPNFSADKIQNFEFVGLMGVDSYTNLLAREVEEPESWFNVRALKDLDGKSVLTYREPLNERRLGLNKVQGTKQVDLLTMYVNLVPKDWGLGKKKYPEKWMFVVAGSGIIIRCQPLGLDHLRYPISVCCPTYDGYSISPISTLEMVHGIQQWIDWCYRSNVDNVKQSLHNMFIADPYLVNYESLKAKPGMIATIRSHVWGRGVRDAVEQIQTRDVTSPLLPYINNSIELIQRAAGSTDSLQGMVRPTGESRTATEMRDARLSALSRVQKGARIASLQSMSDLGYLFAKHLLQFMESKVFVGITGEHQLELRAIYGDAPFIQVDPQDLLDVDFDVVVSDGSNPGGEFLQDLIQMFSIIRRDPEVAAAFDPVRMVLDMMTRANIRGATRFLRNPGQPATPFQVMPNDKAMEAVGAAPRSTPVGTTDIAAMQLQKGGVQSAP